MNELDHRLFMLINSTSDAGDILTAFACMMAKYAILVIPVGITLLWVLGNDAEKRKALILFIAVLIAISLSFTIGLLFPVQRPFLVPVGQNPLLHRASPSFPSNHGLVMFTCAWALFLMSYGWQAFAVGVSGMLVAWSRIYLGVHWPSDMLGAVLIGLGAAALAHSADRLAGEKLFQTTLRLYEATVQRPFSNFRGPRR